MSQELANRVTLLRKRRTLGPFQQKAVAALRSRFPDHLIEDLPQSLHQPNLRNNDELGNVLEKSTGIFSTADLLLDSLAYTGLAGRDNLTVNLNHYVVRLERAGPAVTDVVCWDLVGGAERRYRGRIVVLAAGSLESPRIAMRSGLPDPRGKVGRGLTDHPAFFSGEYGLPPDGEFGGLDDHAKILASHEQASMAQHGLQRRDPDQPEVLGRAPSRRRRPQAADRLGPAVQREADVHLRQPSRGRQHHHRRRSR